MKLTDLSIISMMFFICILVVIHVKSDMLYNRTTNRIMYNNVMDNITEEALALGYCGMEINGKPVVSLEKTSNYFKATTDMYGGNSRYIMCYVDIDGFYICISSMGYSWSDKIYFDNHENTSHEEKVTQLVNWMQDECGINMRLSYNNGEKWENTVDDYSLIVISYEKLMKTYCFSGAKIHKK